MENKARVLVIDDEEDIRNFSKSILERTGRYEVQVAAAAIEGIDLAKNRRPDLILLDVLMPDKDGISVAKSLSEDLSTQNIPIIFLTAVAMPMAFLASLVQSDSTKEASGKLGGFYFIQKPVAADELVSRLDAVLGDKT